MPSVNCRALRSGTGPGGLWVRSSTSTKFDGRTASRACVSRLVIIAALLCGSADPQVAAAAEGDPDPTPILRTETGMHSAPIRRIGADDECKLLATGSDDKTVRLWLMPEGKPLRTQRLPIGPGNAGAVYAVAVSLDGQWVAAGGTDAAYKTKGYSRRLCVRQRCRNHGSATWRLSKRHQSLSFSPDGRRLAVALGGGAGISCYGAWH
jgi:WD40 repeat protein